MPMGTDQIVESRLEIGDRHINYVEGPEFRSSFASDTWY